MEPSATRCALAASETELVEAGPVFEWLVRHLDSGQEFPRKDGWLNWIDGYLHAWTGGQNRRIYALFVEPQDRVARGDLAYAMLSDVANWPEPVLWRARATLLEASRKVALEALEPIPSVPQIQPVESCPSCRRLRQ